MLRIVCVTALVVAASGLVASAAPAHQGNPNFRSHVRQLTPAVHGIDVQVVNYDDSLELQNRSGRTVIVKGYRGEPYARISGAGTVAVNHRSPSYYLNDDRYAEGVTVPPAATPTAGPDWRTIDRSGRFTWHDHRIHWMAHTVPPQVKDESRHTKVFDWRVPLTVGDRPAAIRGTLTWVGKQGGGFPVAGAISLALVALVGALLVAVVRRRRGATVARPAKEAW